MDTPDEPVSMEEILVRQVSADDATRVYEELFNHISTALTEAKKENKKLIINMGESHTCYGAYTLSHMILDIAKRLDITHLGVEALKDDVSINTFTGRTVLLPGTPHGLQRFFEENAQKGVLPETHSQGIAPEGRITNMYQLVPDALALDMNVLAIDTNAPDRKTPEGLFEERETHMKAEMAKHAAVKDALVSCGVNHLDGLKEYTPNHRVCSINTAQHVWVQPIGSHMRLDRFRNPQAFHPRFRTGIVHSFTEGKALVQAASQAVGDKLEAEFKAKLAQTLPTLSHINLGGRSPTELQRRRA